MNPSISHDPYETLGISSDADINLIRNAFRKLALKHHPDRNPGIAEQNSLDKYRKILEAREVLIDPAQRERYDRRTRLVDLHGPDRLRNTPSKTQTYRRSSTERNFGKGSAKVARGETSMKAAESMNSQGLKSHPDVRGRERGRPVPPEMPQTRYEYTSFWNVNDDSETDSGGRQRVQRGLYSVALYSQNKARESSVQSRVSSRNKSLGGGRHFEHDYQEPEFARRRSGSGSDYEIRRSSPGLPPRPSLPPHLKRPASQPQTPQFSSCKVASSNSPPTRSRSHETQKKDSYGLSSSRLRNKTATELHGQFSWSCGALKSYHDAFYVSKVEGQGSNKEGNDIYICLFCGERFPGFQHNWDHYKTHLVTKHRLDECNKAKKFYRSDHFRQHLKYCHVARSGWWTNRLQIACKVPNEPRPRLATSMDPPLSSPPKTEGMTQDLPHQSLAPVRTEYKRSNAVEQAPEFQICYMCDETVNLTGRRAWQIHVFGDLKPYQCLEKTCPQEDTTYASLQELRKHYVSVHAFAEITRARPASCPFCCEEMTSSSLHQRFKHVGRHMEDIAFAVVPRQYEDWAFYSESSTGSKSLHEISHPFSQWGFKFGCLSNPKA